MSDKSMSSDIKSQTEKELGAKKLEIKSLLELTMAINNNKPAEDLFRIYQFILFAQQKLSKLLLFAHPGEDDKWEVVCRHGMGIEDIELGVRGVVDELINVKEVTELEKLPNLKPDTKIEFKEILAYGDNKVIEIGAPIIQGAKVEADLLKNSKNRTVLVFKKRRRQNSRRKNGHRQQYSMIRINKIFSKDGKILSEAEKISKPSKKEVSKKEVTK